MLDRPWVKKEAGDRCRRSDLISAFTVYVVLLTHETGRVLVHLCAKEKPRLSLGEPGLFLSCYHRGDQPP